MKQVTVFKVVGYDLRDQMLNYVDSTVVWVYADKAEEALKKAKAKGVEKKHWSITEVIEKYEELDK